MSLMSMRRKMASTQFAQIIFWVLIVVFIAGVFLWSIPNSGIIGTRGGGYTGDVPGGNVVVATVNGQNIYAGDLDEPVVQPKDPHAEQFTLDNILPARKQIFEMLVERAVTSQAIRAKHIYTWGWVLRGIGHDLAVQQLADEHDKAREQVKTELAAAKTPEDRKKVKTEQQRVHEGLITAMQNLGEDDASSPTEDDYIQTFVTKMMDPTYSQYDSLHDLALWSLLGEKLVAELPINPCSEDFVKKINTTEVRARWIFVAAKDRTKAAMTAAKTSATQMHDQIVQENKTKPTLFAELAKAHSDDPQSAAKGGELGWISAASRNDVSPMALYLAFATNKNEVSPVMNVSGGYAFLNVEDTRDQKDLQGFSWDRDKKVLMLRAKYMFDDALGQGYVNLQRSYATVVPISAELKYYDAQAKSDQTTAQKLLPQLATNNSLPPLVTAGFKYVLLLQTKDPKAQIDLMNAIVQYAGSNAPGLQIKLGQAYEAIGDKKDALEQFQWALEGCDSTDYNQTLHQSLRVEFDRLKSDTDVKTVDKWLKDHPKQANGGGFPSFTIPQR